MQCLYNVWNASNWASVIISLEAYVSSVQGGSLCKHHKRLEKNRSLDPLEFQVCIIFKRSFLASCFCFKWQFIVNILNLRMKSWRHRNVVGCYRYFFMFFFFNFYLLMTESQIELVNINDVVNFSLHSAWQANIKLKRRKFVF